MNIICVKWGDRYSAAFVNRLYKMVAENTTLDFEFYCYTEDPSGVDDHINIIPMPDDDLEGFWPKLRMFEKGFGDLRGKCVYFDLDVVIHNNIDDILNTPAEGLTLVKGFWKETSDVDINSSVILWEADTLNHVWEYFWEDPDLYIVKHQGVDKFIKFEGFSYNHFPRGWIYSRLFGIVEGDDVDDSFETFFYAPEGKVCLFNAVYSLMLPEDFDEEALYSDFNSKYSLSQGSAISG